MTNHKEILRLKSMGFSNAQIASACGCGRNTVTRTLQRAEAAGVSWKDARSLSEPELFSQLYPASESRPVYRMPDYEKIHREMQKAGVTLSLLWVEYCEECRAAGELPYQSTQFNLKQEAKSVAYLMEHGLTPEEMESRYQFASEDFHSQSAALKELEAKIKEKKSIQRALSDYYGTKALHKEYMDAKDKKRFRDNHPELMIYDAAVKELRAHYGKDKFPSRKQISEELHELISEKNAVYEHYCVARDHFREMQVVRTNYYALQGQEHPEKQDHDQTQNRT